MFEAVAGRTAATQAVRRWSWHILDPSLAQVFLNAPDNRRRVAQPGRPMVRARRRCPWAVALIVMVSGGFRLPGECPRDCEGRSRLVLRRTIHA